MDLEERFKLMGERYDCAVQKAEKDLKELERVFSEGRALGILNEAKYVDKKATLLDGQEKNKKSKQILTQLYEQFTHLWALPDHRLKVKNYKTLLNEDPVYRSSDNETQKKFHERALTEAEYCEGWAKVFPHEEDNEDPLQTVSQQSGIGQRRLQEIMEEFELSPAQIIELHELAKEYKSGLSHLVSSYLKEEIPFEEIGRFLGARESLYVHHKISPSGCPVQESTAHPTHISLVKIYKAAGKDIDSLETIMDRLSENKILTIQEFMAFTSYCEDCAVQGITSIEMLMDEWASQVEKFGEHDQWDTVQNRRKSYALDEDSPLGKTKDVYNGGLSLPYPVVKM